MDTYTGVYSVVPTAFDADGALDDASQLRAVDFLIDAGAHGLCILANWSEQFALTDAEREQLTGSILDHVAGRVPVIVTTSHFGSAVAAERSRRAQAAGAAMVMLMAPYHGATIQVGERGTREQLEQVAGAIDIPIMIQDAPMSGTTLSAAFLADLAREIPQASYFKIESELAAEKLRELIRLGGDAVVGPFDGEESITLIPDLEAGATGTMPGGVMVDALRQTWDLWHDGRRDEAIEVYERVLPLIVYENKLGGIMATKVLMEAGGIIESRAPRHPLPDLDPWNRAGLIDMARRLDLLVLRWGR